MKLFACLGVGALVLSACATSPSPRTAVQDDVALMQTIDNVARSRGVQVIWINAPQKTVRAAGSN